MNIFKPDYVKLFFDIWRIFNQIKVDETLRDFVVMLIERSINQIMIDKFV